MRQLVLSVFVGTLCLLLSTDPSFAEREALKRHDERIATGLRTLTGAIFSSAATPKDLDTIGNGRSGRHTRELVFQLANISSGDATLTPSRYPRTTEVMENLLDDPRGRALVEDFWRFSSKGAMARRAFYTLRLVGEQPTLSLVMESYLQRGIPDSEVISQIVPIWLENGRRDYLRTLNKKLATDFLLAVSTGPSQQVDSEKDPVRYLNFLAEIGGYAGQKWLLYVLTAIPPEGNKRFIEYIQKRLLEQPLVSMKLYKAARKAMDATGKKSAEIERVMTALARANFYEMQFEDLLEAHQRATGSATRNRIIEQMGELPERVWPDIEIFVVAELASRTLKSERETTDLLGLLQRIRPQRPETWAYLREMVSQPAWSQPGPDLRPQAVMVLLSHLSVQGNREMVSALIRHDSLAITEDVVHSVVRKAFSSLTRGESGYLELWVEALNSRSFLVADSAFKYGKALFRDRAVRNALEEGRRLGERVQLQNVVLLNGHKVSELKCDFRPDREPDMRAFMAFGDVDLDALRLDQRGVGEVLSDLDRERETAFLDTATRSQLEAYFEARKTRSIQDSIKHVLKER